ncbi:hypothetical protein ACWGKW_34705 [Streptomyces sp. NPDC054766]
MVQADIASDHIAVLDDDLSQIPDAHRHGTDILVRTDSGRIRGGTPHPRP